jgi:threonine/homoserine/homoserine lactone efflux protein
VVGDFAVHPIATAGGLEIAGTGQIVVDRTRVGADVQELIVGATLGLGAGVAPGPLLALLLTSTLKGGLRAGYRVAISPVLSDNPVVLMSLTVLAALPDKAAAVMALAGAGYVTLLGVTTIREAETAELSTSTDTAPALRSALLVNLFNPHSWLFWMSAGAPLLLSAWNANPAFGLMFLAGSYLLFLGTKLAIALLIARARGHVNQTWYRRLLVTTGILLLAAASLIVRQFLPHLE